MKKFEGPWDRYFTHLLVQIPATFASQPRGGPYWNADDPPPRLEGGGGGRGGGTIKDFLLCGSVDRG